MNAQRWLKISWIRVGANCSTVFLSSFMGFISSFCLIHTFHLAHLHHEDEESCPPA